MQHCKLEIPSFYCFTENRKVQGLLGLVVFEAYTKNSMVSSNMTPCKRQAAL